MEAGLTFLAELGQEAECVADASHWCLGLISGAQLGVVADLPSRRRD